MPYMPAPARRPHRELVRGGFSSHLPRAPTVPNVSRKIAIARRLRNPTPATSSSGWASKSCPSKADAAVRRRPIAARLTKTSMTWRLWGGFYPVLLPRLHDDLRRLPRHVAERAFGEAFALHADAVLVPLEVDGLADVHAGDDELPELRRELALARRRVPASLHRPAQVFDFREQLAVAAPEHRALARPARRFHRDDRGLRRLFHPVPAVVPDPEKEEPRPGAGHGHETRSRPPRERRLQKTPAEAGHRQPRDPFHLHGNHEEDQKLHVGEEVRIGEEHRRARHDAPRDERVSRDQRRERGPERRDEPEDGELGGAPLRLERGTEDVEDERAEEEPERLAVQELVRHERPRPFERGPRIEREEPVCLLGIHLREEKEDEVEAAEGQREAELRREELVAIAHPRRPNRLSSSSCEKERRMGRPCGHVQGSRQAARSARSRAASAGASRWFTVIAPRQASDAARTSRLSTGEDAEPSGSAARRARVSRSAGRTEETGISGGVAETRNVRPESSETTKPASGRKSSDRERSVASSGVASNVTGVRRLCEETSDVSSLSRNLSYLTRSCATCWSMRTRPSSPSATRNESRYWPRRRIGPRGEEEREEEISSE